MRTSSKITGAAILALLAAALFIWSIALPAGAGGKLTVSFLDTGKGSAVLIRTPGGQIALIDGGPDAGILRALGAQLPWWQRSLDLLVNAEPDAAHATGLIDVLQRYSVERLLVSSTSGSGPVMQTFGKALEAAKEKGAMVMVAKRGQVLELGGASIEILFPDRDLASASARDACVEMLLLYGKNSFMLSCGNAATEKYLAQLDGTELHADVLSGSAGAATSSKLFAGFVGAQFTAKKGDVYVSDGQTVSREN